MSEKYLNERDKKLVWSLEDALKKKKELGQDEEVNLDKDLKVKQVDTSKDVLVYEYEVKKTPIEELKTSSSCKVPKWLIALACLLALAGIIGALAALISKATTPQQYASGIGSVCNDTYPCDPTLGQICSSGVCSCTSTTPNLIGNACYATIDYLGTCIDSTQCDTSKNLTCTNGICICDSVKVGSNPFWSTKQQKCFSCPSPYKPNITLSSPCYNVYTSKVSWSTARAECQKTVGADLFSASSQTKFEYLTTMLTPASSLYYWIGGYSPSGISWSWVDLITIYGSWSGWCTTPTSTSNMYLAVTYSGGTTACIKEADTAITAGITGYICEIE